MNSNSFKPTIEDLQKNVLDLLQQVSALMNRARLALSSDSGEKYAKSEQEVKNAAENVKNLALRMAVVAPMKAGKSTIINAIVGQDLLPSRNAAMTTLPTEIVFESTLAEPFLTLSPEIRQVFQDSIKRLKRKISDLGIEQSRQKVIGQYPHLEKLLEQIDKGYSVPAKEEGRDRIITLLANLNDMIRLCSVLDPATNPLQFLTDVPRIHTPFLRSETTERSNWLGNLIIIDTPGPNEAGEDLRLANVVAEQLQKSSLVLIVLDFTQLKTEAAEKVKKDVQKVVKIRGIENLYVSINKVDQRRDGDMTPEQVQDFVTGELGLESKDRVFEVAARWGFCAAHFMQELQQNQNICIAEMKTAKALAQEVFGPIDWEEELDEATLEQLNKKAQRLFNKSGFPPFLEKAISALMERAAPKSIKSALNTAKELLLQLQDDVRLRHSAIAQDEEKLRLEVDALEADLQRLEARRTHLMEVDQIKTQLDRQLKAILENLKKEANVKLETFFDEREYDRAGFSKKAQMGFSKFFHSLRGYIGEQKNSHGDGTIEFLTASEAEGFINQAVSFAQQRAERSLENVRQKIEVQIEQSRQDVISQLEKETKPIIEQARQRLNETFHLDLSLPAPAFNAVEIDVKPSVQSDYRMVDQGYETKTEQKRSFWHWLWLVPYEKTTRVKRPDKKVDYYTVSLAEMVGQVNQWIEESVKNIKQGISQYLDEDFQERIDVFFNNLDSYLSNYRDSLRQAQQAQKLSLQQKERLIADIKSIDSEAKKQIKTSDIYIQQTDDIVRRK
jgi:hypothetical protein